MYLKYLFGILFHEFKIYYSYTNGIHVRAN